MSRAISEEEDIMSLGGRFIVREYDGYIYVVQSAYPHVLTSLPYDSREAAEAAAARDNAARDKAAGSSVWWSGPISE